MRYAQPELVDRLAAAYVLGTLSAPARRRFERLRRDRPDVQLAVAAWESRLHRLADVVPAVPPPHRVWQAIDRATRADRAAAVAPLAAQKPRTGWWALGWGGAGVLAGGVLATLAWLAVPGVLFTPDQVAMRAGQRLPQSYVGLLTDAQGDGKLLVSSLRHGRVVTVKVIGPIAPPAQGRLVLWAVPAQGAPFVLADGVQAAGTTVGELPDTSERLLSKVGKLLVTVETQARPAAPGVTLFTGNCAKLW